MVNFHFLLILLFFEKLAECCCAVSKRLANGRYRSSNKELRHDALQSEEGRSYPLLQVGTESCLTLPVGRSHQTTHSAGQLPERDIQVLPRILDPAPNRLPIATPRAPELVEPALRRGTLCPQVLEAFLILGLAIRLGLLCLARELIDPRAPGCELRLHFRDVLVCSRFNRPHDISPCRASPNVLAIE